MQFHAKSAKNDLKPTDFLKHNFYFEMEGVGDFLTSGNFNRSFLKKNPFLETPWRLKAH